MFLRRVFPSFAAVCFFAALFFYAAAAREGAVYGLQLAFSTAIPALFPFLAASALLLDTGALDALHRLCTKPLARLYGLPGAAAAPLLLGLTGGYPVGAAAAAALYREGTLTKPQAERLLGFCNNTGPAFIVGVCGAGVLGSVRIGLLLYAIHAASALLTGLVMAHGVPVRQTETRTVKPRYALPQALVRACEQAAQTSIKITAFLTLFAVLTAILDASGLLKRLFVPFAGLCALLGMPEDAGWPLLYGALELTRGLAILPEAALSARFLLPVCSALLAFGGLSIWCQSISVLADTGLSLRRFACGKLLHTALAAALTTLCVHAMPARIPTFAPTVLQSPAASLPGLSIWVVIILFTITYGKHRCHRL